MHITRICIVCILARVVVRARMNIICIVCIVCILLARVIPLRTRIIYESYTSSYAYYYLLIICSRMDIVY